MFEIFFWLTAALMLAGVLGAVICHFRKRTKNRLRPFYVIAVTVFVSACVMLQPVYISNLGGFSFQSLMLSLHNTIRLFVVDDDFQLLLSEVGGQQAWVRAAYPVVAVILYVMAPMLTFGVVLSFFKSLKAYVRFFFHPFASAFVFSDLNEKSLALARSLRKKKKGAMIVFTNVTDDNPNIAEADEVNALLFRKEIDDIRFGIHPTSVTFFLIKEDEGKNGEQALKLIERYRERKSTEMYVFSTNPSTELMLCGADYGAIKVRRIDEGQKLVQQVLYERGDVIFGNAIPEKGEKVIRALVVGLGRHGTEMLRSLAWFCQMNGYRAELYATDATEDACSRFTALCPELMDEKHNGLFGTDEDACYRVTVKGGVNVDSSAFDDFVQSIPRLTYVFVSLGNDERNLQTAVHIRALSSRMGASPAIQAVVYRDIADRLRNSVRELCNHKNQPYAIEFVGDLSTLYSHDTVIASELEKKALARHMKWGKEDAFWRYEFNYKSSVASALHSEYKKRCGIPGSDRAPEERTAEDREALRRLEHRRWNAYMRSVGYVYSPVRNDMAKTHNCLVYFSELSPEEQAKDDD